MTARRAFAALVALALLVLVFWKIGRVVPHAPDEPGTSSTAPRNASASTPAKQNAPGSAQSSSRAERSMLADALNAPTADIRADLRLISDILETFRSNFPVNGNPTGTNAEITAALTGKNRLHLALIPSDHPAINRDGELCDRWGTPFFFHAESATKMEIRSAGPDRRMWTADDVTFTP